MFEIGNGGEIDNYRNGMLVQRASYFCRFLHRSPAAPYPTCWLSSLSAFLRASLFMFVIKNLLLY
jgi:hypothetical protein